MHLPLHHHLRTTLHRTSLTTRLQTCTRRLVGDRSNGILTLFLPDSQRTRNSSNAPRPSIPCLNNIRGHKDGDGLPHVVSLENGPTSSSDTPSTPDRTTIFPCTNLRNSLYEPESTTTFCHSPNNSEPQQ